MNSLVCIADCPVCGERTVGVAVPSKDGLAYLCNTCIRRFAANMDKSYDLPIEPQQPTLTNVNYYGPDWAKVRAAILERDGYNCQDDGHRRAGGSHPTDKLVVHHRKPLREFGGDYNAANIPENLITLCTLCHGRWHKELNRQYREMAQ